jgi:outer membrane receptor protein involved in Fe transport
MPRKEGNMMVRTLAAAFATTCLVAFATPVAAQTREFNVPAGTLRSALDSFARQSGRQVIYRGDEVRSVKSEGVRGVHTADSALDRLLAGTGFTARKDASGAFAVVKVGNLSAAAEASAASEEDAAEIVVTATKRPERVRDVPFAITVVDAANLTKRGEVRLQDISARIPGLQTPDQSNGGAQTSIVIRGLSGSGAGNPTSAVYVDDTPINASTFFGFGTSVPDLDPGDLARIEVLKGPQGTLYGATSIGGLIKYVSRDPDVRSIEAEAQAGLTSVAEGGEGFSLRARVNVPLSQQAAISVSGFTRRDPGFFDNLANNGRDFNRADNYGGRAALYAEVADNVGDTPRRGDPDRQGRDPGGAAVAARPDSARRAWISAVRPLRRAVAVPPHQQALRAHQRHHHHEPRLRRVAYRVRRSQDDHGAARPRHPSLRYRRDRQRQLALQKPQLTATFAAFKNLPCAARASGRATPALRRTQRKALLNKPTSDPKRGSLFGSDSLLVQVR